MPGIELIQSFLQQATAQGARSTALSPLGWLTAIISSALFGSFVSHAPMWAIVTLTAALVMCVIMYFVAYIFFMMKNPDALRSERFTLSKLALERSVKGDSIAGFLDVDKVEEHPALPSSIETEVNHE
jgi:hypothetical protein